jgi:hypothetical protein
MNLEEIMRSELASHRTSQTYRSRGWDGMGWGDAGGINSGALIDSGVTIVNKNG